MNRKRLLGSVVFWFAALPLGAQIYFSEGFENRVYPPDNTTLPPGWTQSYASGSVNWEFQDGGHTKYPQYPYTRKPYPAHSGSFNALFQKETFSRPATKLITPPINLAYSSKPMLRFWHAQASRFFFNNWTNDELRVYYRTSPSASWTLLAEYTNAVENWTERNILLPAEAKSSTLYIAFEGRAMPGWGTCVDDIVILETDTIPKTVNSVSATSPFSSNIGRGAENVLLMRLDIAVKGNQGTLVFDSLYVNYVGTTPNDIKTNGIRLYRTADSVFVDQVLMAQGSFSGNSALLTLSDTLDPGMSFYWIALDIKSNAGVNDTVKVSIPAQGVRISGKKYPASALEIAGYRKVVRTIFYDSFETDKGWTLTGDFERATPMGKGGSHGNADPAVAYSGTKVLGNDLTVDGDYPPNMPAAFAVSPTINCKYFKNVRLQFARWLNVDLVDNAAIEVSTNNGLTWVPVYSSNNYVVDKQWNNIELNLSQLADRKEQVKIRFVLGPTNSTWEFSGWNVDNFLVYGDTVIYDAALSRIVAPATGCGHTSADEVKVWVVNRGSAVTPASVPVAFSTNNGATWYNDVISSSIPVGDSLLFTFGPKANLAAPGTYNIKVKINWTLDDYSRNDTLTTFIKAIPTYTLPMADDFEGTTTFWASGGNENSWEWGNPSSDSINTPYSGSKAWKTNLYGYYNSFEDSYVESPCFQFNDTIKTIVDFYYYKMIESGDGVALYYSIDTGKTWLRVPSHPYSWTWNWYNKSNIELLEGAGWDGNSGGWLNARQVLPSAMSNKPQVRFRMVLRSDEEETNEGFAFDDFRVYEAPANIRLNSITSHSSACEGTLPNKISFSITNNGIRTLIPAKDKIVAAYKLNTASPVLDTLTLPANLPVGQSVTLTFNKAVGKLAPGSYTLRVYHVDPNKGFYPVTDNDTVTVSFDVYPAPVTGLKDEYATARLDTFSITANNVANCSYLWANAGNSNLSSTKTLTNPPAGYIWLTMQFTTGNHCSITDTFYMRKLIPDVGITAFKQPVDACEFPDPVFMKVVVKNLGTDTLAVHDTIRVTYIDHLSVAKTDTVVLQHRFFPDDTLEHLCLKNALDLSVMNQTYLLKAYTKYKYDSIPTNDTLQISVHSWGYPTVNLGANHTSAGYDTLTLSGFKTYLWSDNSTDSVYIARYRGDHWVRVTDDHDCPASDTVHINVVAHDIKPLLWVSPLTACALGNNEILSLKLKNIGTDTILTGEKAYLRLKINNGATITDSIEFSSDVLPYDTVLFQFAQPYNFSATDTYNIKVYVELPGDVDRTNDTLWTTVYHYGYPVVNLGTDRTVKAIADTLDAGSGAHWAYTWHDNSHNRTIVLTNTVQAYVTVTDTLTGCAASDTVNITFEIRNGGVTNTNLPLEICHGTLDNVQVEFTNTGNMNIPAGDTVLLGYKINNILYAPDTVVLTSNLTPGGKILRVLTGLKNRLDTGNVVVKLYSFLRNDVQQSNDTLTRNITVHPTPYVNFDAVNDTIVATPPYVLQAPVGSGYSYTWTPAHSGSSYSVTSSGWYKVKVETPFGCKDSSKVYVNIFVPDGGITSVLSVPSACAGDFDTATVVFQNLGTTIIPQGTVLALKCKVGNKPEKVDSVVVGRDLLPPQGSNAGDTLKHTFRGLKTLVSNGTNNIKYYSFYTEDIKASNDTAYAQVEINPIPTINLEGGQDTVWYMPEGILSANKGPNYHYLWNTGETTESITIYTEGKYWVRITHKTTGCKNSDTIYVKILHYDLAITNVDLPTSMCYGSIDSVSVEVTNMGNTSYDPGTEIQLIYMTDQMESHYASINLSNFFNPGEKFTVKIGRVGEKFGVGSRTVKFYPMVFPETDPDNDTLVHNINVVALPAINFGTTNDTVTGYPGFVLPTGLDKNAHTFLWSNGKTTDTIHVMISGYYWVQATHNSTVCSNRDTVYARVRIPDGTITAVSGSSGICSNNLNSLNVTLRNNGTDPMPSGTMVRIGIQADNKLAVVDTSYLTTPLAAGSSRSITVSNLGGKIYAADPVLKVFVKLPEDIVPDNDTFAYNSGLLASYRYAVNAAICEGDAYTLPSGTQVSAAGTYTSNLSAASGCDSIIITHLTVHPTYSREQSVTICQGDSYLGHTTSGTYIDTLNTVFGCDSVVTTHLTVNPSYHINDTVDICDGNSYKGHTTSGTYVENLHTSLGCDSIVTTVLRVHPQYNIEQDVFICIGETYNGHDTTGTFTDYFTSYWGCDSTVITHLTVGFRANVIDTAICEGESFMGRTQTGTYYDTIAMSPGCDSLIILHLTVHPLPRFHLADGSPEKTTYFPYTIVVNFEGPENPNDFNYLWNDTGTMRNATVDFAGTYQLTVTNKVTGCSDSRQIILHQPEEYDITLFDLIDYNANTCSGSPNQLTAVIKNIGNTYIPAGSHVQIKLTVNNKLVRNETLNLTSPLLKNATRNYSFGNIASHLTVGSNTVKAELVLTGDTQTANDSKTANIQVNQSPTINLANGRDTVTYSTSSYTIDAGAGYDAYLWNTESTGRYLVVSNTGRYWVRVTKNGCTASDTIFLKKVTGIPAIADASLEVFPVPATSTVTMVGEGLTLTNPVIEILTTEGKLYYKEELKGTYSQFNHTISVERWSKGMYIMKLYTADGVIYRSIVVQ